MNFRLQSKKLLSFFTFMLLSSQYINAEIITQTYPIQKLKDDVEEYDNGHMSLYSSDLELGGIDGNHIQIVGLRYQNITLPEGATITGLFLQFHTDELSESSSVEIKMETGDNSKFSSASYNLSQREYTNETVSWEIPEITQTNQDSEIYRSPSLLSLLNEAKAQNEWDVSKGFIFKIEGNGDASSTMDSRESGKSISTKLIVTYDTDYHGGEDAISDPELITDIYVNEISAKGTKNIHSDWIELYNDHDFSVLLNDDFYLSNKKKSLDKFQLHNILIPAKSYVTFYADEKPEEGDSHTNFKLKGKGGKVYLSKNDNGVISKMDTFEYEESIYDETFGRYPNGNENIIKFRKSGSFAHSNENAIQNIDIDVDHQRGIYEDGTVVTLTTSQPSTIYYTTDGSFPSKTHGEVYSDPIEINDNMVVKAIAFNDKGESKYVTNTYIVAKNNTELKYKNLVNNDEYITALREIPIISISKDSSSFTSSRVLTTFEYIDTNEAHNNEGIAIEAGVKKFGAWSNHFAKNNLRFYFKDDFGYKELDYDIFSEYADSNSPAVDTFKRLELKIGEDGVLNNDFTFGYSRFSDKLMHDAMLDMGHLDVHTKFVHVFVNGKYYGVETLRERYDGHFSESYLNGDDNDYVRINNKDGYWHVGHIVESQYRGQWNSIKADIRAKDYQAVKNSVEIEDYIKMMLMYLSGDMEYEARGIMNTVNSDEKIRFSLNDSDGLFWNKNGWRNITHWGGLLYGPGYLFGTFLNDNNLEFKTNVKDDVAKYIESENAVLSTTYFSNKINILTSSIDKSYKLDVSRWGFREDLHAQWKQETNRIISEFPTRFNTVHSNLASRGLTHTLAKTTASMQNQSISIANPNANTITYFTTDSSDPMGNDGAIRNSAMNYAENQGELNNVDHGTLTIRAYKQNNWGPKTTFAY